ncbi:MAG: ATP-binding protein [Oscillospiraceae bacterium]|nr:ATP-binding protein [Oscillospiraceae bacterium]
MKELWIEAKTENLDSVMQFISEQLEAVDCPVKTQTQIAMAVEEIFVNIAYYAYSAEVGGLGIFMVKSIMDAVEYRREDDKNILIIKKRRL